MTYTEAGKTVTANCTGWCAVGSFDYSAYEKDYAQYIPCTPDEESF